MWTLPLLFDSLNKFWQVWFFTGDLYLFTCSHEFDFPADLCLGLTKDSKINFSNGNESLCELHSTKQKSCFLGLWDRVLGAEFAKAQPHTAWAVWTPVQWGSWRHPIYFQGQVVQPWALHLPFGFLSLSFPAFLALVNDPSFLCWSFYLICIWTKV